MLDMESLRSAMWTFHRDGCARSNRDQYSDPERQEHEGIRQRVADLLSVEGASAMPDLHRSSADRLRQTAKRVGKEPAGPRRLIAAAADEWGAENSCLRCGAQRRFVGCADGRHRHLA
ncbi:hypothetical protein BHE97_00630 [Aeromicrobium sp. PE09-221]|nr:hypothetical protein BHE97_00630 [Aeromicrobium sp. PE09-221]